MNSDQKDNRNSDKVITANKPLTNPNSHSGINTSLSGSNTSLSGSGAGRINPDRDGINSSNNGTAAKRPANTNGTPAKRPVPSSQRPATGNTSADGVTAKRPALISQRPANGSSSDNGATAKPQAKISSFSNNETTAKRPAPSGQRPVPSSQRPANGSSSDNGATAKRPANTNGTPAKRPVPSSQRPATGNTSADGVTAKRPAASGENSTAKISSFSNNETTAKRPANTNGTPVKRPVPSNQRPANGSSSDNGTTAKRPAPSGQRPVPSSQRPATGNTSGDGVTAKRPVSISQRPANGSSSDNGTTAKRPAPTGQRPAPSSQRPTNGNPSGDGTTAKRPANTNGTPAKRPVPSGQRPSTGDPSVNKTTARPSSPNQRPATSSQRSAQQTAVTAAGSVRGGSKITVKTGDSGVRAATVGAKKPLRPKRKKGLTLLIMAAVLAVVGIGVYFIWKNTDNNLYRTVYTAGQTVVGEKTNITFSECSVIDELLTYNMDSNYIYIKAVYTIENTSSETLDWHAMPYLTLSPYNSSEKGYTPVPYENGEGHTGASAEDPQSLDENFYGVFDFNALQIFGLERDMDFSQMKQELAPGESRTSADIFKIKKSIFDNSVYFIGLDNFPKAIVQISLEDDAGLYGAESGE